MHRHRERASALMPCNAHCSLMEIHPDLPSEPSERSYAGCKCTCVSCLTVDFLTLMFGTQHGPGAAEILMLTRVWWGRHLQLKSPPAPVIVFIAGIILLLTEEILFIIGRIRRILPNRLSLIITDKLLFFAAADWVNDSILQGPPRCTGQI